MKSLRISIERFCTKHPGFGIPKLMLGIVLLTGAVTIFINPLVTLQYLSFDAELILQGQIWRLITWIFIFISSGSMGIFFTFIALYFYYFIGSTLEREWGTGQFTVYYLLGMLLHVIFGFVIHFAFDSQLFINPVYLNMSMFFAFAVLFPDFTVRLFFIIPVKIKWLALINAAFFAFSFISSLIAGSLITAFFPVVALLNFFLMCGDELYNNVRRVSSNAAYKSSPQVLNFKKEAKKVRRAHEQQLYRHKCAVCGKTDTEFPSEEFRYCSKCQGYHCFCSEHINNHVHFRDDERAI